MSFKPHHINATADDFHGNGSVGRYVLLPGSPARAEAIAEQLEAVDVKYHPRGHHLYLGKLMSDNDSIDVAVICTGMGTSSTEIILYELYQLGARRFLRVGTAGSLQSYCDVGDIIIASGAVRDDSATEDYAPLSFPAMSSHEWVASAIKAAAKQNFHEHVHVGIVHSKSSLYAKEFCHGPLAKQHQQMSEILKSCQVVGSEMEAAMVFLFAQLHNTPADKVLAGTICAVISHGEAFANPILIKKAEQHSIALALATVFELAAYESNSQLSRALPSMGNLVRKML